MTSEPRAWERPDGTLVDSRGGHELLRTGRKVGRTIYVQHGLEPADDDPLIGVMDTEALASRVVDAVNGAALHTVQELNEAREQGMAEGREQGSAAVPVAREDTASPDEASRAVACPDCGADVGVLDAVPSLLPVIDDHEWLGVLCSGSGTTLDRPAPAQPAEAPVVQRAAPSRDAPLVEAEEKPGGLWCVMATIAGRRTSIYAAHDRAHIRNVVRDINAAHVERLVADTGLGVLRGGGADGDGEDEDSCGGEWAGPPAASDPILALSVSALSAAILVGIGGENDSVPTSDQLDRVLRLARSSSDRRRAAFMKRVLADLAAHEDEDDTAGDVASMLAEFHAALGQPFGEPTAEGNDLRIKLHSEEHRELVAELDVDNLPGIAHELADVVYVAYGTAHSLGIPLDAVIAEVHRANMSKAGPDGAFDVRADGKVLKGPHYRPPNIQAVLGAPAPAPAPLTRGEVVEDPADLDRRATVGTVVEDDADDLGALRPQGWVCQRVVAQRSAVVLDFPVTVVRVGASEGQS